MSKPSDEAVAAVEAWGNCTPAGPVLDDFANAQLGQPHEEVWRPLRDQIALLLDAQRDAVLDEVVRRGIDELGWSPHARAALTRTIGRMRR